MGDEILLLDKSHVQCLSYTSIWFSPGCSTSTQNILCCLKTQVELFCLCVLACPIQAATIQEADEGVYSVLLTSATTEMEALQMSNASLTQRMEDMQDR